MDNENKNDGFSYTYSAQQREEVDRIRKKYEEPAQDKMTQLKKLDQTVTAKAASKSIVTGVIGALVMGIGMSLVMTDIGAVMNLGQLASMVLGVVIGVAGLVPVCLAYPVYMRVLARERKLAAPEILRLTDELMK